MVKELCRDVLFLGRRARPALPSDAPIADDLAETLFSHKDGCVGMAANMIGENVAIIVFDNDGRYLEMFNPEIVRKECSFNTYEGCLCHEGRRPAQRYKKIKVRWQTREGKPMIRTFEGFPAQIIQHECDHLNGIII